MSRSSRRRPLSIRPSPRPMVCAVSSPISAGNLSRSVRGDCLLHHGVNFGERHRRLRFGLGIDCDRSAFGLREMCAQLVAGSFAFIGDHAPLRTRMPFCRIGPPEIASRRQWLAGRSRVRQGLDARCARFAGNLRTWPAMPREKAQAELVPDGARSFGSPGCTLSCRAAAIGRHQNSETPGAGHPPGRPFLLAPAVMRATDGGH